MTVTPAIEGDGIADLLARFGADFDRRADLAGYYSPDFTAIVGDEALDRTAYLASIAAMYKAGARGIGFDIDLRRNPGVHLLFASGTTSVEDGEGVLYGSRFTILCGGTPLQFLHVHSSPARPIS